METYQLQVTGMSCNGCEERVENAVKQVDGVRRVEADHESDEVEVTADSENVEQVSQAIYDAGYEAEA
ncbi:MAG: heavy-metal-associated domain-containing protein [Candidatus Nanohaloarchaea archaeon]